MRAGNWALAVGLSMALAGMTAHGQSTPPAPTPAPAATPAQDGNPFPGEPEKPSVQAKPDGAAKPDSAAKPDNAFPGEDTAVPIIPVDGSTPADSGDRSANEPGNGSAAPQHRGDDPDGDPVRSPDGPGDGADDGFSSSRAGLGNLPVEDTSNGKPGKSVKNKTREQILAEDVDVGNFYMEKKNWKAAQLRFQAAFALDRENADAVWGLAEAERHLQMNAQAAEHYRLFLSYDPDGPHGKAARRGLEQVEAAGPVSASRAGNAGGLQPK